MSFNIKKSYTLIWKKIHFFLFFYSFIAIHTITEKVLMTWITTMVWSLTYSQTWSITTNKAGGDDEIPAELFNILKDDAMKVLHSIYQEIRKTQHWPQDWKRSVFIPIPKKGNAKEYLNYRTMVLISHANKVMLKILQVRLQQDVNWELPDVQAGFRKKQKNQKSNCQHLLGHRKSKGTEKHLLLLHLLH